MALKIREELDGRLFIAELSEKLHREDYERFVPETERLIQKHGKISILVIMHNFHGWDAGALWEDIKWDLKHFNHIARLAVVGEQKWQAGMTRFCRPFTRATVRYFEQGQLSEARDWAAGVETSAPQPPAA